MSLQKYKKNPEPSNFDIKNSNYAPISVRMKTPYTAFNQIKFRFL